MQASDYPLGQDSPITLDGRTIFTNYYIVYPEGRYSFISKQMRDDLLAKKLSFQELKDMGYVAHIEPGGDMVISS